MIVKHGIGKLYPTPFKFNWFNENGVFGRDSGVRPKDLRNQQANILRGV